MKLATVVLQGKDELERKSVPSSTFDSGRREGNVFLLRLQINLLGLVTPLCALHSLFPAKPFVSLYIYASNGIFVAFFLVQATGTVEFPFSEILFDFILFGKHHPGFI